MNNIESQMGRTFALTFVGATLAGCATVHSTRVEGVAPADTFVSTMRGERPQVDPKVGGVDFFKPGPQPGAEPPVTETVPAPTSASANEDQKFSQSQSGIAYFLPRQLAKVIAKRTSKSLAEALTELGKVEVALAAAKAAMTAAKGAINLTTDQRVAATDDGARRLLDERLADQKLALKTAETTVGEKEQAVTEAKKKATAAAQPQLGDAAAEYNVSVKIEMLPPSADPKYGYRLNPKHSWLRDDKHKVVVSAGGLLTSTDIVAEDRTGDVIVDLATFAGAIMTNIPPARSQSGKKETARCDGAPDELSAVVDFADPKSIAALNDELQCIGARLIPANEQRALVQRDPAKGNRIDGIAYRTPVEVFIRIERCTRNKPKDAVPQCSPESGWFPTEIVALSLPQAGPISYVRQDAGIFTKTTYKNGFSNGILVDYDANRPSEVANLAALPLRVLNGIFDGASQIISLRTGKTKKLTDLTAAELALLQEQAKLQAQPLSAAKGLSEAELALQQAQLNILLNRLGGGTQISQAELSLINAQGGLLTGANTNAAQLSASALGLQVALGRDAATRDAIFKCVGEKTLAGESILGCYSVK